MSDDKRRWIQPDSKFGYSPFVNQKKSYGVVSSNDVNSYVIANK